MPQKNPSSRRLITPLLLFTLAGWALWALGRNEPASAAADENAADRGRDRAHTPARTRPRATWSKRRLATSLAFTTLFFAGAAFSAGAGEVVVSALEGTTSTEAVSTESEPAAEEEAPAEEPAAEEEPSDGGSAEGGSTEGAEPGETGGDSGEPADDQPAGENGSGDQPAGDGSPADGEEPGGNGGSGDQPAGEGGSGDEPAGDGEPGGGSGDQPGGSGPTGDDGGGDPSPHLDEGDDDSPSAPASESPLLGDGADGPSQLDPEADVEGFFATVWLHRTLADPTPPAKRLTPLFAKTLVRESARAHVDWALVLGVLRASGFDGGTMSTTGVRRAADRLVAGGARRDAWRALLAYRGRTSFADRALALTRYNRAVGLSALVTGLEAARPALQQKVLRDSRVSIYPAGRLDVAMGRVNVRILVLIEFLAEAHGEVTVSSLISGHRLYARPGVVSAHVYGLAIDIAALGGTPIAGHQDPNGLTERAVRNILLLPAELQPRQVISLLGLGGPSFPLADHWDHIHVGY
jgi:hypothetical protein